MTERERLIELIDSSKALAHCGCHYNDVDYYSKQIADYLLENGVMVLPCKVDDTIYITDEYSNEFDGIDECKITSVAWNGLYWVLYHDMDNFDYPDSEIGRTIFFTREEAEKTLERREAE